MYVQIPTSVFYFILGVFSVLVLLVIASIISSKSGKK